MNNNGNTEKKISLVTILFFVILFMLIVVFSVSWFLHLRNGNNSDQASETMIQERANLYIGGSAPGYGNEIDRRTITLFYLDGENNELLEEEREIVRHIDQISEIRETIIELFRGSSLGLQSPVPEGTVLREVFIDSYQTVYVDITEAVRTNHNGGIMDEILTIQSLIKSIRTNFPQISRVQILVEGKEVETLAGHIAINRPLTGDEFVVSR